MEIAHCALVGSGEDKRVGYLCVYLGIGAARGLWRRSGYKSSKNLKYDGSFGLVIFASVIHGLDGYIWKYGN